MAKAEMTLKVDFLNEKVFFEVMDRAIAVCAAGESLIAEVSSDPHTTPNTDDLGAACKSFRDWFANGPERNEG